MKKVKNREISPKKKSQKKYSVFNQKKLYNHLLIIKNPHLFNIQLPCLSIKFKFEV